jgi:hypothetical protein
MDFTHPPAALKGSLDPDPVELAPKETCARCSDRTARHMADMQEIARIGMRLLHLVEQRAEREAEAPPPNPTEPETPQPDILSGNLGLTFSRIARAVCLANTIEDRLANAQADRAKREQADATYNDNSEARRVMNRQKYETRRMVKREIMAGARKCDIATLLHDLEERLDSDEVTTALTQHGIASVVLSICRDLGIKADLTKWSDDEVGMEFLPEDPDWVNPDYQSPGSMNYVPPTQTTEPPPPETTPESTARDPP